jgi:hypothetical protein
MFASCKTRLMVPTSIDALDDEMVTCDGEIYDLSGLQDCVVDNGMDVFSEHDPLVRCQVPEGEVLFVCRWMSLWKSHIQRYPRERGLVI